MTLINAEFWLYPGRDSALITLRYSARRPANRRGLGSPA
jgi:hypothetical protein